MKMDGMLSGIRVLDSTTAVAMPTAMHILADMGAEVIKIETPTREEAGRRDESFQYLHHSKKSMTIKPESPRWRPALQRPGRQERRSGREQPRRNPGPPGRGLQ